MLRFALGAGWRGARDSAGARSLLCSPAGTADALGRGAALAKGPDARLARLTPSSAGAAAGSGCANAAGAGW
jgi:hypothetical protein